MLEQVLAERLLAAEARLAQLEAGEYVARAGLATRRPCDFPEALLVANFDGPPPFGTDFSGNASGHGGQVANYATAGVIWRQGKFGKAVQVAEDTINLVHNPSAEAAGEYTQYNAACSRVTTDALYGSYCYQLTENGATTWGFLNLYTDNIAQGTQVTCSVWLKVPAGSGNCNAHVALFDSATSVGATVIAGIVVLDNGQWQRFTGTYTWPNATAASRLLVYVDENNRTLLIDGAQVEAKAYVTPYADGSLGRRHAWNGTPHGSYSVRTGGVVSYPAVGNFPTGDGTVAAWVREEGNLTGTATVLRLDCGSSTYAILRYSSGNVQGYWGAAGEALSVAVTRNNNWHHLALTRSGTSVTLYRDGVAVASGSMTALGTLPTVMWLGSGNSSGTENINGLIDDLVVLPRALSASEIRALYDCGQPASGGADQALAGLPVTWRGVTFVPASTTVTIFPDLPDGVYLLVASYEPDNNWRTINWIRVRQGTGSILTTENNQILNALFSGDDLQLQNTNATYGLAMSWGVTRFY